MSFFLCMFSVMTTLFLRVLLVPGLLALLTNFRFSPANFVLLIHALSYLETVGVLEHVGNLHLAWVFIGEYGGSEASSTFVLFFSTSFLSGCVFRLVPCEVSERSLTLFYSN